MNARKGVKLPADPAIGELVASLANPEHDDAAGHNDALGVTPLKRIEAARQSNRLLQKNFAEGSACWILCQEVEADLWHAAIDLV